MYPGLNPGWIGQAASVPHYAATSPNQAQYYWGAHPYTEMYSDLSNYQNTPYAPSTPWGAATSAVGGTNNALPQFIQNLPQMRSGAAQNPFAAAQQPAGTYGTPGTFTGGAGPASAQRSNTSTPYVPFGSVAPAGPASTEPVAPEDENQYSPGYNPNDPYNQYYNPQYGSGGA